MKATIKIQGQIAPSYVDENGLFHKGTVLLDVVEQAESVQDANEFDILVDSPGGYVDIGDAIHDYILSLKKKGKVTTIQTGLVGSIATKIFLAGDERLVDDRFQFWIHNPFKENVSGDSDELMAHAQGLAETENKLRQFYMGFTKISDEGLDALMKAETGLTADQCIKFGFATGKKSVPVKNIIKPIMKDQEKSFMEHVRAFFAKAEIPSAPVAEQNVEEEMIPKSEVDALIAAAVQKAIEEKEALPDTEVPVQEEEEEMIPKSQVEAMVKAAVEAAMAPVKKENEEAIMALKKSARIGVPPTKAVLGSTEKSPVRTIASVMREKEIERKKQLNKN